MGQFLHRAGHDYVIFERGARAGTFFNKYPVQRKLNSVNRKNLRTTHPEFRLRYDWHTLLENDNVPRFPNWTNAFLPSADDYVDYLNAFQREQQDAGQ
jgi:succinylglutamate desuccinylase